MSSAVQDVPRLSMQKTDFFRIGFVATTLLAEILDLPRTVGARREVGCARIAQLHNALLKIMHELFLASESSQNIIRVLFVDFTKAFDVIDNNVLSLADPGVKTGGTSLTPPSSSPSLFLPLPFHSSPPFPFPCPSRSFPVPSRPVVSPPLRSRPLTFT